jgi:hypothetical protein
VQLPDAEFNLRVHRLSLSGDSTAPTLTQRGVLVRCRVGPFTLRREYLVPEAPAQSVVHVGWST